MADYTDPTRKWNGVEALRRTARSDFGAAMAQAIQSKIEHVAAKGRAAHPRALRAAEAFCNNQIPMEDSGH